MLLFCSSSRNFDKFVSDCVTSHYSVTDISHATVQDSQSEILSSGFGPSFGL